MTFMIHSIIMQIAIAYEVTPPLDYIFFINGFSLSSPFSPFHYAEFFYFGLTITWLFVIATAATARRAD